MRVQMITAMAGPGGNASPGQVIDVDDQTARLLTEGGYAVYVDAPRQSLSVSKIEAAVIEPPEHAVKRTYKRGSK